MCFLKNEIQQGLWTIKDFDKMMCYTKFELQYNILILWESFGCSIPSFYFTKIRIKMNFNKIPNY